MITQYGETRRTTADQSAGPSSAIWYDFDMLECLRNPGYGYCWFDDFLDWEPETTTAERHGSYLVTKDASSTLTAAATVGGVVQLFTTADNEEAGMQLGSGAPFVIPAASTTGKKLWFEARIKKSVITASKGGFFVGLASEGACAADFIADGGADFADVDLLGFWNLEAETTMDIITQKTSAAFDTIGDATGGTLVADTWIKVGFKYDPEGPAGRKIVFYYDGVASASTVGEASGDATVYIQDTTNFPGGEEMSPIAHVKAGHADDLTISMDWWRCAQLR